MKALLEIGPNTTVYELAQGLATVKTRYEDLVIAEVRMAEGSHIIAAVHELEG